MLLRLNMFLPPTFLDLTFAKLTVYLNFTIFLSFCLDLFLLFLFAAVTPLFHFLRIVAFSF